MTDPIPSTATFEALSAAMAERDAAREAKIALYRNPGEHPLEIEYRAALDAQWREWLKSQGLRYRPMPTGKKATGATATFLDSPERKALRAPFEARAKEISGAAWKRCDVADRAVFDVAYDLTPRTGPVRLDLATYSTSDYSTQGPGGDFKYARCRARVESAAATAFGIPVEIEERRPWPEMPKHVVFAVVVSVTDARDVEILKARGVPRREWVRLCWKNGCQPRVFDPFLPHGFEEKNGLDYFGGPEPVKQVLDNPTVPV